MKRLVDIFFTKIIQKRLLKVQKIEDNYVEKFKELPQGDLTAYYRFLNELGDRFHASHHLVMRYTKNSIHYYRINKFYLQNGSVFGVVTGKKTRITSKRKNRNSEHAL